MEVVFGGGGQLRYFLYHILIMECLVALAAGSSGLNIVLSQGDTDHP